MTKDEFEAFYAKNMGMTVGQLRVFNASIGRDVRPCTCEDESCQGWQMVNVSLYEEIQRYLSTALGVPAEMLYGKKQGLPPESPGD